MPAPLRLRSALVAAAALPFVAVSACDRSGATRPVQAAAPLAALPMTEAPAPPSADAPRAAALPVTRPVRLARVSDPSQAYAYLDRAYGYGYGFGDSPPDYTFNYGGVDPYAWRGDDGAYRMAEPLGEGRYRFYYFEPGAERPFLIRDPDYAYGYSDGALAAVYGPGGEVLPYASYGPRLGVAAALLTRAVGLYDASRERSAWRAVSRADWDRRQAALSAQRSAWSAAQARNAEWRAYHDAHQAQYADHFAAERERREADAARFAQTAGDPGAARRDWAAARQAVQPGGGALPPGAAPRFSRRDDAVGPPPFDGYGARGRPPAFAGQPGPGDVGRQQAEQMRQAQRQADFAPPPPSGRIQPPLGGPSQGMAVRQAREPQAQQARQVGRDRAVAAQPQRQAQRAEADPSQRQQAQVARRQRETQRAQAQASQQAERAQMDQARQAQHQEGQAAQQQARAQAEQARQVQRQQAQAGQQQARAQAEQARQARRQQAQAGQQQARGQAEQARQAQRQQAQAGQQQARGQAEQARQAQHQQAQAAQQQARAQAEQARQAQHQQAQAAQQQVHAQAEQARQAQHQQAAQPGGPHGPAGGGHDHGGPPGQP